MSVADQLSDVVFASQALSLDAASGSKSIVVVSPSSGDITIGGFRPSKGDILDFAGFGVLNVAAILSSLRQVGSDTLVVLGSGQTLTLTNVSASSLAQTNILVQPVLTSASATAVAALATMVAQYAASPLAVSAASNAWLSPTTGSNTITGTAKNDRIQGAANLVMSGGAGDDTYVVYNQSNAVIEKAGEGVDTVLTWATQYRLTDNVENLVGQGTSTAQLTGNDLANVIVGNTGNDVLDGGKGNDQLTGNGVSDTFVISLGGGVDTVTNFSAGDIIRIQNAGIKSFADLQSRMAQVGSNVFVALSATDGAVLNNVALQSLTAANFQFASQAAPSPAALAAFQRGVNTYIVAKGNGSVTLTDFVWTDKLEVDDYGFTSFAQLRAAARQSGADTTIALGGGDVLTLKNTLVSTLSASNVLTFNQPSSSSTSTAGATTTTTTVPAGTASSSPTATTSSTTPSTSTGTTSATTTPVIVTADVAAAPTYDLATQTLVPWSTGVSAVRTTVPLASLSQTVLTASAVANSWITATSATTVNGTAKNDQISANASTLVMAGGLGDDIYIATSAVRQIIEKTGEGIDTVRTWLNSYQLASDQSIENLVLEGTQNSSGTGNGLNNIISGNTGSNGLTGGKGNDTLVGGGGSDTFVMGVGDGVDTITDFSATGAGADVIQLTGFTFHSWAQLLGQSVQVGADVQITLAAGDGLILKNAKLTDLSDANFKFLKVPDVLIGSAGDDVINGGDGDDTLTGGAGRDTFVIAKGNGSDTITDFKAGAAGDFLDLQAFAVSGFDKLQSAITQKGADTLITFEDGSTLTLKNVQASALQAQNFVFESALPVSGSGAWMTVTGTSGVGTAGNDTLVTSKSNVILSGGAGDDTYLVNDQSDSIVENAGNGIDTVTTYNDGYELPKGQSVENLTLLGTSNSSGFGNELDNLIKGNTGSNLLNGAGGNDVLTGGGGHDVFIIQKGQGNDVITDFGTSTVESDKIRLGGFSFSSYADIAATMRQVGTNVSLDLGNGQTLTLANTTIGALGSANFVLPLDTSTMVRTFNDDFNTLSLYDGYSGTWATKFNYGDTLDSIGTSSALYTDASFKGVPGAKSATALGLNPFSIADGKLTITASPAPAEDAKYLGGYGFTSGMLSSQPTFSQTYGYFQMTATLPSGHGAFPAFWLIPEDGSWPPEIDALETFGDKTNMVHSGIWDGTKSDHAQSGNWFMTGDLTSGQHQFGVLWTPYTISFYVDGQQTGSYATPAAFNKPMYMIANLAMGGSWAGTPDPNQVSKLTIDSISAYQLPEYTLAGFKLLTSGAATNTITGTSAAETLAGTGGNDLVNGSGGTDTLAGGLGDDTYVVDSAGVTVTEAFNAGIDTVKASVSYALSENVENLTLTGTTNLNATGNALDNIIVGNTGSNVIMGGLGNDILTGGGGPDTFVLASGDGSDIITDFAPGQATGDVVQLKNYGFGTFGDVKAAMTQVGSDVQLTLNSMETLVFRNTQVGDFTAANFVVPGVAQASGAVYDWINGTAASETLVGTGSNDHLDGLAGGADTLIGGLGDDTYAAYGNATKVVEKAGQGIDTVVSQGSYTLLDNVENLTLNNWYTSGTGNSLNNRMTGGAGPDTLNGKGGDDYLYGGAGNDTFIYEKGSGFDTVADFHVSTGSGEHDLLQLAGYGAGATLTHNNDVYTVNYTGGSDSFRISGVTNLTSKDYAFVQLAA